MAARHVASSSPSQLPLLLLLLLLQGLLLLSTAAAQELPADYNANCLKDKNLAYSSDNYVYCKNSEAAAEGRTECCKVGGETGCCKPTEANRMLKIAAGIIGVSLALGLLVYICTWCDRETWPCIGRVEDAWRPHQHKLEESLICCREKVERRRLEEEHRRKYAARADADEEGGEEMPDEDNTRANVKLEAPQEFKASVQDSWF